MALQAIAIATRWHWCKTSSHLRCPALIRGPLGEVRQERAWTAAARRRGAARWSVSMARLPTQLVWWCTRSRVPPKCKRAVTEARLHCCAPPPPPAEVTPPYTRNLTIRPRKVAPPSITAHTLRPPTPRSKKITCHPTAEAHRRSRLPPGRRGVRRSGAGRRLGQGPGDQGRP